MKNYYSYSPKAYIFKKCYGDIQLTVLLELPKGNFKKDGRIEAIRILKDEIYNLLNDSELEKLLVPQK